jgi:hypothetical protein
VRFGTFTAGSTADVPQKPVWSEWKNMTSDATAVMCKKTEFNVSTDDADLAFRCECKKQQLFDGFNWRNSSSMNVEGALTAGQECQLEHELVVLEGGTLHLEGKVDVSGLKATITAKGKKSRHFSVYGRLVLVNLILEKGEAWVGGSLQVRGELAMAHLIRSVIRDSSTGWPFNSIKTEEVGTGDNGFWNHHGGAIAVSPLTYNQCVEQNHGVKQNIGGKRRIFSSSTDGLHYSNSSDLPALADPRIVRLILEDSIIENCKAAVGGGVVAERSTIEIRGNTFIRENEALMKLKDDLSSLDIDPDNIAGGMGGGLWLRYGSVVKAGPGSKFVVAGNLAQHSGTLD